MKPFNETLIGDLAAVIAYSLRGSDLSSNQARIAAQAIADRLEQVPGLWVYTGERLYIEGVPFGGWMETGEGYRGSRIDPCEPVYRLRLEAKP